MSVVFFRYATPIAANITSQRLYQLLIILTSVKITFALVAFGVSIAITSNPGAYYEWTNAYLVMAAIASCANVIIFGLFGLFAIQKPFNPWYLMVTIDILAFIFSIAAGTVSRIGRISQTIIDWKDIR